MGCGVGGRPARPGEKTWEFRELKESQSDGSLGAPGSHTQTLKHTQVWINRLDGGILGYICIYSHAHTDGGVHHAGRQPARQEQSG